MEKLRSHERWKERDGQWVTEIDSERSEFWWRWKLRAKNAVNPKAGNSIWQFLLAMVKGKTMKSSMEGKIAKNMERQLAWCTYVCVCVNEIFCSDFSLNFHFCILLPLHPFVAKVRCQLSVTWQLIKNHQLCEPAKIANAETKKSVQKADKKVGEHFLIYVNFRQEASTRLHFWGGFF